ncbi:MAG: squalene/phytoene synthase family protein [Elusimicrobia bacterium]|nr:squalene/phytoene synthase family protein [Elusimicrobiota bacterium]
MTGPAYKTSNFSAAFMFLGGAQRRALSAFYAYARAVDDIADDPAPDKSKKLAALASWKMEIEALFSGEGTGTIQGLKEAVSTFPLKKEHFLLVLEGVSRDLDKTAYSTIAELESYMYKVASAVGLTCLAIFGYEDQRAGEYAENLGYAVQLTNIIRDAREDALAGRFYLPSEDMRRFGCRANDLLDLNYPPNFIELMSFEAGRARAYYAKARALINPAGKKKLFSAFVMAAVYETLLEKITASGFRVKRGRIRLNKFEKMKALYRAWRNYAQI